MLGMKLITPQNRSPAGRVVKRLLIEEGLGHSSRELYLSVVIDRAVAAARR
jgi:succinyl-CoA synthetase beta subunit